ncbi:MAG TPA: hypothetical protein VM282_27510 [Acidimicrobiales bacterium]|nr:hypothetical protein [Acidimicrobiales bacterium]
MTAIVGGRQVVWVVRAEGDVALFWHESDALQAVHAHLARLWPHDHVPIPADTHAAVELYNHLDGVDDHVAFGPYPVAGNQHFEGDRDTRSRCRLCREPIELEDENDPESWIHTQDANYFGDHTAAAT